MVAGDLVVVLIDMQDGVLKNPDQRALIPRQVRVLEACRIRGIPVVYLELEGGMYGQTNYRLREVLESFPETICIRISKRGRNGFDGTDLYEVLCSLGAKWLLVMGVSSCRCVYETMQEAKKRSFLVRTSFDLIAPHCDERDHMHRRQHFVQERDCPFCESRQRWLKQRADCQTMDEILSNIRRES